ncbi:uncharacterized protein LOC106022350 isoform X2 [Mesocricetus auratus]|uniref:Uncharacterized protein LOC106022350 isoform X2 n=1 Tax=Mesocricetus auratus TaxID=10036 RepID=A0ABM2YK96_MESAU|nr:uncharacterized protein LOC106022350 isoform X2 [Mesocricetus auratus]
MRKEGGQRHRALPGYTSLAVTAAPADTLGRVPAAVVPTTCHPPWKRTISSGSPGRGLARSPAPPGCRHDIWREGGDLSTWITLTAAAMLSPGLAYHAPSVPDGAAHHGAGDNI